MSDEIDDILNADADADAPGETKEETPETPEGDDEVTEPKEAATPAAKETPETEDWTKTAVLDERRKRQQLEQELNDLRAKQDPVETPDPLEDPQGAMDHLKVELATQAQNERVNMSREMLMLVKDDYEEKEKIFVDLASSDSMLVSEMMKAPNPALFAYNYAVKHERFNQVQNVDELEKQLRAKIIAELAGKDDEGKAKAAASVGDLVDTTSSSGTAVPTDDSLASILDGR